jgi:hypothetical protein
MNNAESIIADILESPRIVARIMDGLSAKDAVGEELQRHINLWNKTDRSTAKGRELDDLAINVTFQSISQQLA